VSPCSHFKTASKGSTILPCTLGIPPRHGIRTLLNFFQISIPSFLFAPRVMISKFRDHIFGTIGSIRFIRSKIIHTNMSYDAQAAARHIHDRCSRVLEKIGRSTGFWALPASPNPAVLIRELSKTKEDYIQRWFPKAIPIVTRILFNLGSQNFQTEYIAFTYKFGYTTPADCRSSFRYCRHNCVQDRSVKTTGELTLLPNRTKRLCQSIRRLVYVPSHRHGSGDKVSQKKNPPGKHHTWTTIRDPSRRQYFLYLHREWVKVSRKLPKRNFG
jgi:hypothetical protein